ncbi:uncharacterized protein LOC113496572 [Trichoplusia ni]|uniref:Uncharacterized protein LOC113496572 n=1 Tax=Trichoplusia ni TaxID=7111 RepID=A0A7E5VTP7_TRINI|nr:uncharacterized protein LOC113496572 [Trichoplusia ni]
MEALSNLQFNLYSAINRAKCNYKKSPKERMTSSYIEARLENLQSNWDTFCDTHKKIITSSSPAELEISDYNLKNLHEITEELFIDYKAKLNEDLKTVLSKNSKGEVSEPSKRDSIRDICTVKLPKIELPIFTGKYSEWISFRDLFTSLIYNNKHLDDIQKLHYLKTHLSGEAESLLRHIPITSDNFLICWSQLENRYNNKKYLANCVLKRFMSQRNVVIESSSALKELLDTSSECLHALENLGINVDNWDIIVIYILSLKLDDESRKQWELKISDSDALPSFREFKSFLEQRFRALEFLNTKGQRPMNRNVPIKTYHISSALCPFCKDDHKLANCKKFCVLDVEKRRDFVQTNSLCYNCLSGNHSVYVCRQSSRCHICRGKHHTLLHFRNVSKSVSDSKATDQVGENSDEPIATTSNQSKSIKVISCFANSNSQILLATALIAVELKGGTAIVLRALIDQGSQASFITESAAQLLGLKKIPTRSSVSGIGGDQGQSMVSLNSVLVKVKSRIDPSFVVEVKAYVLNKLTSLLPQRKVRTNVFNSISSLVLADPNFDIPNKIDLLLGADVYGQILLEGLVKGPPGLLIAQNTKLGWILSGQVGEQVSQSETCHNTVVSLHSMELDENTLLKQFWELEAEPKSVKDKVYLTPEEQKCEEIFKDTTKRDESGRYIVHMPFRSHDPACKYGGSKDIALKRFLALEKRFLRNPEFKAQYSAVINEYIALNHMDLVQDRNDESSVYLPHHAVIRNDKSTTKLRVVFDASCVGSNGVSLNHDLMVGPRLQSELRHIIMRWRCEPICLVADIVKMYRQIKVCNDHTDFQRILWRENPDDEIQVLRHLRVTFGTSSAPYLAVRSLQQLAQDEGAEFPLAKNRVLSDFYMDDLLTGCQTIQEGVQIYKQMSELLKRGGFPLQKWASNSKELLRLIEDDQQILQTQGNMELKTDSISKILGLTWDKDNDEFVYTIQLNELDLPVTKRKVISDISRLFDPLGWLAPAVITAKVFIQRIWMTGIEWDAELPAPLLEEWLDYRKNLRSLAKFRLPRWIKSSKENRVLELHGFSDASNVAYAAVVYARIIDKEGHIHTTLVTAKTKVAPVKQVSIPRLELCGAVLLAKLLQEVASTLEVPKQHLYAWTDSTVVLAWLSSHPSRWKTFIANRVSEILTIMDRSQWSHVMSSDNPADCASRGVSPSECNDLRLWKRGPLWLQYEKIDYNRGNIQETTLEERKIKTKCHAIEFDDSLLTRFSKFSRLIRVISYCKRFLRRKELGCNKTTWLTTKELNEALLTCIKLCQLQSFNEEIETIKNNRKLSKGSRLISLSPFLDDDGILRVGGRLHRASIDENMKHPILIPHKSNFTNLLIAEAHERTLHGGPQLMLNYLRSKYWILNAKTLVRQHVHKCITCIRHSTQTHQQMMGQLPKARVSVQKPFQCSGVDYAGPISIRSSKGRGHHPTKGYICLFVCMSTRAIHLEVVSDMTSQSFLASFKRFVARRGRVVDLWSDNGTTFVGSARELRQLFNAERSTVASEIVDFLSTNGTTWHFIPPHAPNFGGLWEAGVKSTKHHLKRIIGTSTLTFEEMTTVLAQIEACLNSRPISQLSNNPEDSCPLTPGHFLVGEPLVIVPDVNYENSSVNNLKRWHLTQKMVQNFWRRWSLEYLTQLQHRYKWTNCNPEPEIGDVVLVKEDGLPPARWLYGIIKNKHPGLDNITRVVTIRCKNNEIKRPVSKLIFLPVNA